MKKHVFTLSGLFLSLLAANSCVISEESAAQLNNLTTVASILVDEDDAQKLETLQSIGEIIITVEETK